MKKRNELKNFLPEPVVSITLLISFIVYYFYAQELFSFPDLAWHISAGDYIRATGKIPYGNPWAAVASDTRWYNLSWLWDIGLSAIQQYFGLKSMFFITIITHALIASLLCYSLVKRQEYKTYAIFLTLLLAVAVFWQYVTARPQTASYLFVVLFHMIVHRSRQQVSIKAGLWLLPVIMALWVNLHGAFLIGFTIIGAYAVEAYMTQNIKWLKSLIITGFLCVLALVINPYGLEITIAVARTLDSDITKFIKEWQPFTFGLQFGTSLCLFAFILVTNIRDNKVLLADKILVFFWLFASLSSIRHFPMFMILAAPYFAHHIGNIGRPLKLPAIFSAKNILRCSVYSLVIIIFMLLPFGQSLLIKRNVVADENMIPFAAINYIKQQHPDKIFLNGYDIGGYLIYFGRNKSSPFIDGRAGTAYSEEVVKDYLKFVKLSKGWEEILDKYNVSGVIVKNNDRFASVYKQGMFGDKWVLAFEGRIANVYLRN